MSHYMVELRLEGRPTLVVGGGQVARRKIAGALRCGARVTVLSPETEPWIQEQVETGRAHHIQEAFSVAHLEATPRPILVFAATSSKALNREIAYLCTKRGLLCNSADDPKVSSFLVSAMVRRSPIVIGVGTEGHSPALSRLIKERIERWLEPGWGELARAFGEKRPLVKKLFADSESRARFWREACLAVEQEARYAKKSGHGTWLRNRIKAMRNVLD